MAIEANASKEAILIVDVSFSKLKSVKEEVRKVCRDELDDVKVKKEKIISQVEKVRCGEC